jgi:hypothetical protein
MEFWGHSLAGPGIGARGITRVIPALAPAGPSSAIAPGRRTAASMQSQAIEVKKGLQVSKSFAGYKVVRSG